MNDRFVIYFLITVPLYFGSLYWVVLPVMRRVSVRIQGTSFTYRLKPNEPTKTPPKYAKYDIAWPFVATLIAFVLSVIPFGIIEETGLWNRWFRPLGRPTVAQ